MIGSRNFEYISPPALDEEKDEIIITFTGLNLLEFASARKTSLNTFNLTVDRFYVAEAGDYPITISLSDNRNQ